MFDESFLFFLFGLNCGGFTSQSLEEFNHSLNSGVLEGNYDFVLLKGVVAVHEDPIGVESPVSASSSIECFGPICYSIVHNTHIVPNSLLHPNSSLFWVDRIVGNYKFTPKESPNDINWKWSLIGDLKSHSLIFIRILR